MFRFENLDIWKRAADVALKLFDIADELEVKRKYRFAEQLRGAALSMPNNIAEGSGSTSYKDFIHFLNIARRSTFESANMLMIFDRKSLISRHHLTPLLSELDELCRMITAFARSLRS
jgi:four helix bundle protein